MLFDNPMIRDMSAQITGSYMVTGKPSGKPFVATFTKYSEEEAREVASGMDEWIIYHDGAILASSDLD